MNDKLIHLGRDNNAAELAHMRSVTQSMVDVTAQAFGVDQAPAGQRLDAGEGFVRGGRSDHVQNQDVAAFVGKVPATVAAADKMLADNGVRVSRPLGRTAAAVEGREPTKAELKEAAAEMAPGHAMLKKRYKGVYTETLAAEARYAQDKDYQMRLVSDDSGAYGVASGWFLGKTGFQIDYLSPIEHPRPGHETKDVKAGLAIMRKLASEHGAGALWVEVDPEMRKHYEKAGFVDIASPHPDDPAQLTMMVLPLSGKMKKALSTEEGKTKVWSEHVTAWYAANWEPSDPQAAKDAALAKMRADADRGVRTWYQELPPDR